MASKKRGRYKARPQAIARTPRAASHEGKQARTMGGQHERTTPAREKDTRQATRTTEITPPSDAIDTAGDEQRSTR